MTTQSFPPGSSLHYPGSGRGIRPCHRLRRELSFERVEQSPRRRHWYPTGEYRLKLCYKDAQNKGTTVFVTDNETMQEGSYQMEKFPENITFELFDGQGTFNLPL